MNELIKINILIYHKCQTCSGEPTLVNSERTVANAEDASAKSVSCVNTTSFSAENASDKMQRSSASPKLDEY